MHSSEWREIALKVGVLLIVGLLISVAGYGYSRSRFREHATAQAEATAEKFVTSKSWTRVEASSAIVDQWKQACPAVQVEPTEDSADARGHLEKVRVSSTEITETGARVELTPDGGRSVFTLAITRSGEGRDEEWRVSKVSCATP